MRWTNLKKFLQIKEKLKQPLQAVIGLDPAMTCTGWSLMIFDGDKKMHLVEVGTISPKKADQHKQLAFIYQEVYNIVHEFAEILIANNIKLLGSGVEIPAVLLGGRQRASRDITQIQSIGCIRAAMGSLNQKEHVVRPISVHSLAGANQVNYFKKMKEDLKKKGYKKDKIQAEVKDIKKKMIKAYIEKFCTVYCKIKKLDESDAAAISILAWKELR